MKKGLFITIYGVNNIGKSTHARKLVERLKREGYPVTYLKYPIYDLEPTGRMLNEILRKSDKQAMTEEALQTLFMQNRKDFEPTLRELLAKGNIVVAEDYTGTGIAWGMAKGLDQEWLEHINRDLLKKDFALLLTGNPDTHARETHHIHEQNDQLLARVSKILVQLGQKYGWHTVEIQPRIEDTAELIWQKVEKFLEFTD